MLDNKEYVFSQEDFSTSFNFLLQLIEYKDSFLLINKIF
jgi:hypothetical protein